MSTTVSDTTGAARKQSRPPQRAADPKLLRLAAAALAMVVLGSLAWGLFWQQPAAPVRTEQTIAQWLLSPLQNPRIGAAPVVRGGQGGGFIPRGLCASSVDEAAEAACVVYPDGRLFLPRTDRGPRFVSQLLYDPETSTALALSLYRETFLFGGRQGQPEEQAGWQTFAEPVPLRGQQVDEPEYPDSVLFEHGTHSQMAVSPDGTRLAVARLDGAVELWEAEEQRLITQLDPPVMEEGDELWVGFSPDGSHVVVVSNWGLVRVWESSGGRVVARFNHYEDLSEGDHVRSAGFAPTGDRLITYATDGTIRFWDVGAETETSRLALDGVGVEDVSISPNGRFLAALDSQRNLHLWDLSQDNPSPRQIATDVFRLGQHAFSSDGEMLAVVGDESLRTQLYQHQRDNPPRVLAAESMDAVYEAHFLPRGRQVLLVGPHGEMEVHDVASGGIRTMPLDFIADSGGGVVQFAPEAGLVALSSDLGLFVVIDLLLPGLAVANPDERAIGGGLAFLPSTRSIAIDVPDSGIRFSASPFGRLPNAIGFAENGRLLSVGPDGFLASLELEQEGPEWPEHTPDAGIPIDFHAVHSRDGVSFAVGSAPTVARESQPGDWERLSMGAGPADGAVTLRAAHVASSDIVLVGGDDGVIFLSMDGGSSWSRQHAREGLRIDSLHVEPDGTGWASGLADGRPVWLHASNAAEGNWRELNHLPAPWWFALFVFGLPIAGYSNARAWRVAEPMIEQSIADRAVNDLPLDWSGVDALGLKSIARSLSRFLRNVDTQPPLTIAVTGRWGSGKSSLMNLLHQDLKRHGASTVWFNAWHHRSEDHLFAALMEAIRNEGVPPAWSPGGLAFRFRLLCHRSRRLISFLAIMAVFVVLAFGFFSLGTLLSGTNVPEYVGSLSDLEHLPPWIRDIFSALGTRVFEVEGFPAKVIGFVAAGAALWASVRAMLPFPIRPAVLMTEITRRTSLSDFSERLGFRHLFGKALGEVATVLRRPTSAGLVIFIDDLDRCHPEHVLSVLEAVNFVVNAGPCVVVMGMDRKQVEHAVGLGFAKIAEGLPADELGLNEVDDSEGDPKALEESRKARKRAAYARRYMQKLVNLEVATPPMQQTAVGVMLSGARPGSGNEQTALHHDPGELYRTLLPFWNGLRRALPATGAAVLAAALLFMFVPAPDPGPGPPSPVNGEQPGLPPDPEPSPPGSGGEPDPPEPAPEPGPTPVLPRPVPLLLPSEPAVQPFPEWALWTAASIETVLPLLLAIGGVLVFAGLVPRRRKILRDSPDFKRALGIVEPLLMIGKITPRDIRRWENKMRFIAERLRVDEHTPDSLEIAIDFFNRALGRKSHDPGSQPSDLQIPEPTLIALGAIEFARSTVMTSEPGEWGEILKEARSQFEISFANSPRGLWPDQKMADRYNEINIG